MKNKMSIKILFLSCLLLFGTISGSAGTEEGLVLIVVSDNFADTAIAQTLLAEYPDAILLIVEWGTFDEDLSAAIDEMSPSKVIIVGGPQAVVSEYEELLDGTTVERLCGNDRSGTSLAVFNKLKEKNNVQSQIKIVNGGDEEKVNNALHQFLNNGNPFLLEEDGELGEELDLLESEGFTLDGEEGDPTDPDPTDPDPTDPDPTDPDPTDPEDAMYEPAQQAIELAKETMQSLTLAVTDDCKNSVTVLHANAIRKISEAEAAFEAGNYGKAYGQANAAYHLALNALRILDNQSNGVYVGDLSTKALDWINESSSRRDALYDEYMAMETPPEELLPLFDSVDSYLADALACYDLGDYECALNNAALAKDVLRDIEKALDTEDPLDGEENTGNSSNNGNSNKDKNDNGNSGNSNKDKNDNGNSGNSNKDKNDNGNSGEKGKP